jgi:hypothetical protein
MLRGSRWYGVTLALDALIDLLATHRDGFRRGDAEADLGLLRVNVQLEPGRRARSDPCQRSRGALDCLAANFCPLTDYQLVVDIPK